MEGLSLNQDAKPAGDLSHHLNKLWDCYRQTGLEHCSDLVCKPEALGHIQYHFKCIQAHCRVDLTRPIDQIIQGQKLDSYDDTDHIFRMQMNQLVRKISPYWGKDWHDGWQLLLFAAYDHCINRLRTLLETQLLNMDQVIAVSSMTTEIEFYPNETWSDKNWFQGFLEANSYRDEFVDWIKYNSNLSAHIARMLNIANQRISLNRDFSCFLEPEDDTQSINLKLWLKRLNHDQLTINNLRTQVVSNLIALYRQQVQSPQWAQVSGEDLIVRAQQGELPRLVATLKTNMVMQAESMSADKLNQRIAEYDQLVRDIESLSELSSEQHAKKQDLAMHLLDNNNYQMIIHAHSLCRELPGLPDNMLSEDVFWPLRDKVQDRLRYIMGCFNNYIDYLDTPLPQINQYDLLESLQASEFLNLLSYLNDADKIKQLQNQSLMDTYKNVVYMLKQKELKYPGVNLMPFMRFYRKQYQALRHQAVKQQTFALAWLFDMQDWYPTQTDQANPIMSQLAYPKRLFPMENRLRQYYPYYGAMISAVNKSLLVESWLTTLNERPHLINPTCLNVVHDVLESLVRDAMLAISLKQYANAPAQQGKDDKRSMQLLRKRVRDMAYTHCAHTQQSYKVKLYNKSDHDLFEPMLRRTFLELTGSATDNRLLTNLHQLWVKSTTTQDANNAYEQLVNQSEQCLQHLSRHDTTEANQTYYAHNTSLFYLDRQHIMQDIGRHMYQPHHSQTCYQSSTLYSNRQRQQDDSCSLGLQ